MTTTGSCSASAYVGVSIPNANISSLSSTNPETFCSLHLNGREVSVDLPEDQQNLSPIQSCLYTSNTECSQKRKIAAVNQKVQSKRSKSTSFDNHVASTKLVKTTSLQKRKVAAVNKVQSKRLKGVYLTGLTKAAIVKERTSIHVNETDKDNYGKVIKKENDVTHPSKKQKSQLEVITHSVDNESDHKKKALEETKPETQSATRTDATYGSISSSSSKELVEIILDYDGDKCNDIIRSIQKGIEISDFDKYLAHNTKILDLSAYPESIENIAAILKVFKNIEILNMPKSTVNEDLKVVGELEKLQELTLKSCTNITCLTSLVTLISLKSLDLSYCTNISGTNLAHIASLISLESLNLSGCKNVTNTGLTFLASLTSLKSLHLAYCDISDFCLASLPTLTNLEYLDLTDSIHVSGTGFLHLAPLTSLRSINLSHCISITDASLAYLATITSLQSLNLENCHKITDSGIVTLNTLTSLESLDLSGANLTGTHPVSLATLTSLQSLKLSNCRSITDTYLANLAIPTSLQSLDLTHCSEITDDGFACLAQLTSLKSITLIGCNITGTGFAHLVPLISLHTIDITQCKNITDAGLACIATLTSLQFLKLACCTEITIIGLAYLAKLTSLRYLNLAYCTGITYDDIVSLSKHTFPKSFDLTLEFGQERKFKLHEFRSSED